MRNRQAFTLVELSIALVIIGLLIGGILVGQSLIDSAKVMRQISEWQQLGIAVNNYKSKFRYLPGDDPNGAQRIGKPNCCGWQYGNGDGYVAIAGAAGTTDGSSYASTERCVFWAELYALKFWPKVPGDSTGSGCGQLTLTPGENVPEFMTKKEAYYYVTASCSNPTGACDTLSGDGNNYIFTAGYPGNGPMVYPIAPGVMANIAGALDGKLDDGLPFSGNVTAIGNQGAPSSSSQWYLTPNCTSSGKYNFNYATKACNLSVKADF